jgi:hypothetical protein
MRLELSLTFDDPGYHIPSRYSLTGDVFYQSGQSSPVTGRSAIPYARARLPLCIFDDRAPFHGTVTSAATLHEEPRVRRAGQLLIEYMT